LVGIAYGPGHAYAGIAGIIRTAETLLERHEPGIDGGYVAYWPPIRRRKRQYLQAFRTVQPFSLSGVISASVFFFFSTLHEDVAVDRPRLKANFTSQVDADRIFLIGEGRHVVIEGQGPIAVLPYLDGRHTIAQIAQAVGGQLSLPQTFAAIRKFGAFGQLADGRPDLPAHEIAHWDTLGIDPGRAKAVLRDATIAVVGLDSTPVQSLVTALTAEGMTVCQCGPAEAADRDDALIVVCADNYLDPRLDELDRTLAAAPRPWLLAKASSRAIWLGPLIEHGRTGCWYCMAQRMRANRQVERYLMGRRDATPIRVPHSHAVAAPAVLAGLLATEVATMVVTGSAPNLDGRMVTLDLEGLATDEHVLVRRPQCERCGDPTLISGRDPKVTIASRPLARDIEGGLRAKPTGEVYQQLRRHVSPIIGAVTWLVPFSEVDNGLSYSYRAGHNFAMIRDRVDMLRRNLRGQSGGKGRTDLQARVSALAEAIERYSGLWRSDEPVRSASYAELGPDQAVHPNELTLFSDRQYEQRLTWNANPLNRLHTVPYRLPDTRPIDWTPCWSVTRNQVRYIPAAYAWFGHPDLEREFYCFSDSNGNAAGTTREDAILQGFLELVERDAVAMWWYNRIQRPAFDLDALGDPYVDRLRAFYADLGRSLWMLDITADLGIPTMVAVSHRTGHQVQDILVGFGAHFDPQIAAARALTEVNQFLPQVFTRDQAGDTVYLDDDPATMTWLREVTIEDEPWLTPRADQPARGPASYSWPDFGDLADAVALCVDVTSKAGLEFIVLDQTQPDLDLNVVKVLVPGLRHFWRRLGPGRLYTVPARLGWQDRPRQEDELNPRSMFF
jgi:bacteriocin biosynthesis cyclodehydratase domain-containing protein